MNKINGPLTSNGFQNVQSDDTLGVCRVEVDDIIGATLRNCLKKILNVSAHSRIPSLATNPAAIVIRFSFDPKG